MWQRKERARDDAECSARGVLIAPKRENRFEFTRAFTLACAHSAQRGVGSWDSHD